MTVDQDVLTYGLLLIASIFACALIYLVAKRSRKSESPEATAAYFERSLVSRHRKAGLVTHASDRFCNADRNWRRQPRQTDGI